MENIDENNRPKLQIVAEKTKSESKIPHLLIPIKWIKINSDGSAYATRHLWTLMECLYFEN
jgi:hypothetical protein